MGMLACLLGLLAYSEGAAADRSVTARLEAVAVTFILPDRIRMGDTPPIRISLEPAAGEPLPDAVRARVGMPDMGHWIGEQGTYRLDGAARAEFSAAACQGGDADPGVRGLMCLSDFDSLFPMRGRYRLRVWLDYADGREIRTAIDFDVGRETLLELLVVE